MIKPAIYCVAQEDLPIVWKCVLWMARSVCGIIPMKKLSHPITSCEVAYLQSIGGRLRLPAHSKHVVKLHPSKYRRSRSFTLGCVPSFSIHFLTSFFDCRKAAARPASGQLAMCLHVCCFQGSLGTKGSNRPDMTGISWYLLCQVLVWKPIVEIAVVTCGASCGQISSPLH